MVNFSSQAIRPMASRTPWPAWAMALLALAAVVLKYGVGLFPAWVYLYDIAAHANDPSSAPLMVPPADYLLGNFLAPWILGQLGLVSPTPYFLAQLMLTIIAIAAPFLFTRVRRDPWITRTVFVIVAGGGLAAVQLRWVAGYDALTILGLTFGTLAPRRLAWLGFALAGLNHPLVAALAWCLWVPMVLVTRGEGRRSWPLLLTSVAALLAGSVANTLIVASWGGSTDRWSIFQNLDHETLRQSLLANLPAMAFSVLGLAWVLALLGLRECRTMSVVLLVEAAIVVISIPLLGLDATRLASMVMLPATLAWAVGGGADARGIRRAWPALGIAAAIVLVPVLWNGEFLMPAWPGIFDAAAMTPPDGYTLHP